MIDLYCERVTAEFWAEPLNAITNAAFLIAAAFTLLQARREGRIDAGVVLLALTVFAIGLGSFAFHTLATPAANLADVLPILIFQLLFLVFYPRRVLGWRWRRVACAFILYGACVALFASLPQSWLNGSLSYFPAFSFLGFFGVVHRRRNAAFPNILLAATATFAVSLTFRSLDNALCGAVPIGTHFLWHCLNALVLYLTMAAYWRNAKLIQ